VKEMLRHRSGEVRLYGELLRGLQMRQDEGWSELSTVMARKGRKQGRRRRLLEEDGWRYAVLARGRGSPFIPALAVPRTGRLGVGVAFGAAEQSCARECRDAARQEC
jgi:hypothetical protein